MTKGSRLRGRIVKGIAGFYYVDVPGDCLYACRARGIFRKEGVKPLVGDEVEIEVLDEADREANLVRIHPRKNVLIRPAAANMDQAMLIFALRAPDPDPYLIDRFLVSMEWQKIPVFLCFNKEDLAGLDEKRRWGEIYSSCRYEILFCSAKEEQGIAELQSRLAGKRTVVAGPSGAGKSTLINLLQDETTMETGEVSRKLGRGRHTTRHAELLPAKKGGWICDTPGFTSLFLPSMEKEELADCFPEFSPHAGKCRFPTCSHTREPDCAVREALDAGAISRERYQSYTRLYEELLEQEKKKY